MGKPRILQRAHLSGSEWILMMCDDYLPSTQTVPGVLLSHFSRVPLCATPIDGSPPGSSLLGFSRQEHWSGLPFPSPMHDSEKWKWSRSVMSDSYRTHGPQPTRLLLHHPSKAALSSREGGLKAFLLLTFLHLPSEDQLLWVSTFSCPVMSYIHDCPGGLLFVRLLNSDKSKRVD